MKRMILRLMSLVAAMVIACGALSTTVYAGPTYSWDIPDNVRIVQQDPVDGVRTFSTIGEALASITDASASNPYEVIVMPGTYSGAILKPYVTVKGLDREAAIIQGNFPHTGDGPAYLENLTINSGSQYAAATWGGDLTITNCYVTGAEVYSQDANLRIRNSEINTMVRSWTSSNIEISDSQVTGNGSESIRINNNNGSTISILNSEIEDAINILNGITSCTIAKSKIADGVLPGMSTCKIVHSYDGDYDPIPNQ